MRTVTTTEAVVIKITAMTIWMTSSLLKEEERKIGTLSVIAALQSIMLAGMIGAHQIPISIHLHVHAYKRTDAKTIVQNTAVNMEDRDKIHSKYVSACQHRTTLSYSITEEIIIATLLAQDAMITRIGTHLEESVLTNAMMMRSGMHTSINVYQGVVMERNGTYGKRNALTNAVKTRSGIYGRRNVFISVMSTPSGIHGRRNVCINAKAMRSGTPIKINVFHFVTITKSGILGRKNVIATAKTMRRGTHGGKSASDNHNVTTGRSGTISSKNAYPNVMTGRSGTHIKKNVALRLKTSSTRNFVGWKKTRPARKPS